MKCDSSIINGLGTDREELLMLLKEFSSSMDDSYFYLKIFDKLNKHFNGCFLISKFKGNCED